MKWCEEVRSGDGTFQEVVWRGVKWWEMQAQLRFSWEVAHDENGCTCCKFWPVVAMWWEVLWEAVGKCYQLMTVCGKWWREVGREACGGQWRQAVGTW